MTLSDHKHLYSRFLKGHEGKLHFAAHSHHFWPDVTRDAQLAYWDDCALLSDEKWNKVFSEVIPGAQSHIAQILNLKHKEQIVFAPNTHELTTRILSLFLGKKSLSVLTTTSEFHSWRRQILRLSELPEFKLDMVSADNFLTNRKELIENLKAGLKKNPDLFFISQVFFDSGLAFTDEELFELSSACSAQTIMVIDGYHGFAAIPTDLSKLEGRVFYLSGGYKYAQAGEGVGFLVVPKGDWRPAYTGWFAEYTNLTKPAGAKVGYSQDGMAFMGATQDPTGFYRFNAVWDLFKKQSLNVTVIHDFVKKLQFKFLENLPQGFLKSHSLTPLFEPKLVLHGHFLTFESSSEDLAKKTQEELKKHGILIDRRGRRLRFGFGLYQNENDVSMLCERLQKLS